MSALEILNVYKDVVLNGVSYCKLCLRTEKERHLVKPNAIISLLEEVTTYKIDDVSVCYICEAHAASALLAIRRLAFAVSAEVLFKAMKCSLTLDSVVKIEGQGECSLYELASDCDSRLTAARARDRLTMTEVLVVHGGGVADEQATISSFKSLNPKPPSEFTLHTPKLLNGPTQPQNKPNRRKSSKSPPKNVIETVIVLDDEDTSDSKATQTDDSTNSNDEIMIVATSSVAVGTNMSATVNQINAPTTNDYDYVRDNDSLLNNIVPIITKSTKIINDSRPDNAAYQNMSTTNNDVPTIVMPAASVVLMNHVDKTELISIEQTSPNINDSDSLFDTAILTPDRNSFIMKDEALSSNFTAHTMVRGKDGHLYIPSLCARLVDNQFEYVKNEVIEKNLGLIKIVIPNEIDKHKIRVLKDLNETRDEMSDDRVTDYNLNKFLKEQAEELERKRQTKLANSKRGGKRLKRLVETSNHKTLQRVIENDDDKRNSNQKSRVQRKCTQIVRNYDRNAIDDKKQVRVDPPALYPQDKSDDSTEKNSEVKSEAKRPILSSGRIDWEDKIPMDVISFVDAVDPNADDIVPGKVEVSMGVLSEVRSVCSSRSTGILRRKKKFQ